MDATKYFRIISVTKGVMHFEMMGFWSDEVADQIGGAFLSRLKEATDEASSPGKFIVLADFTNLAVLSQKARVVLSHAMAHAKKHGLVKGVEVVPNAITALSIREAAELTGKDDFRVVVKTLEEAEDMVEKLKQEL